MSDYDRKEVAVNKKKKKTSISIDNTETYRKYKEIVSQMGLKNNKVLEKFFKKVVEGKIDLIEIIKD